MWKHLKFSFVRQVDDDLRDLVNDLEYSWLGCWKGMLLGAIANQKERDILDTAVTKLTSELNKLLGKECVNPKELEVNANQFLSF